MKGINFTKLATAMLISLSVLMQSCTPTQVITDSNKEKIATKADIDFLYNGLKNSENLKLKKLTYYLDVPLVISSRTNFILDGNGATFIMKNKQEDVVVVEFSENVILKNFKATHIEPEGPIGCTGSVIQIRNSANVSVEKCELNGSGIIGVVAYEIKGLKVLNNYIYNNSSYGVLFDTQTSIEIKGNTFEDNGDSGKNHVGKALDAGLSEIEKIEKDTNKEGLKMSNNIYK